MISGAIHQLGYKGIFIIHQVVKMGGPIRVFRKINVRNIRWVDSSNYPGSSHFFPVKNG